MSNLPAPRIFILPLLMFAALLPAACGDASQPVANSTGSPMLLNACRLKGVESEVRCATLNVYENRETRLGRKIGINIVVLPATARVKETDPVFLFAGGPGQAAAALAPQALAILGSLNNKRDIVLIDQRGTGKSNGLTCKIPEMTDPALGNSADPIQRDEKIKKILSECRDVLSQNADLTQYTTTIAMADYDEVRVALGYSKINLWGASYGTRAAMEYLRRYPERVRSVVIDGVAPPSMVLPVEFAQDAGAAYQKLLSACEKEAICVKNFPAFRQQIDTVLERLANAPQKVMLANPLTGKSSEVAVTRDMVLAAIFSTLYLPEMAAILPAAMNQAAAGDFAMLMTISAVFTEMTEDQSSFGMRLSVTCAEDIPRYQSAMIERAAGIAPFRRLFIDEFAKACEVWPKGKMATDFDQPVKSDKPVLILSGGLDPVTPPVHGDEVKKTLTNAVHFIAPNVGHGVSHKGCAPKLVKKFIETASTAGLDGECLKKLPRALFYEPLQEKKPTVEHRVVTASEPKLAGGKENSKENSKENTSTNAPSKGPSNAPSNKTDEQREMQK